ncbi:MAG TPA: hypothetical protein VHV74_09200 [Pseudonocardiaceae bacterium]|nr:hypothetical protein [Pseudonocardiaceae bacterium]
MRSPTIALVWLAATAAAVAVSWLGVRTVVHEAVVSPPQLAVPSIPVGTVTPPAVTSIPPPTTTTTVPAAPTTTVTTTTPKPVTTTSKPPNVHSYAVQGGQVVLALNPTSATLVSATPADGYSAQAWQESGWLRVDFTKGDTTSSLFATWNGHAPTVQTFVS